MIAGIRAALSVGAYACDVVAVEARKAAEDRKLQQPDQDPSLTGAVLAVGPQVTSLTLKRLAELPPDSRPLPTVDAYDQLLRHRPGS